MNAPNVRKPFRISRIWTNTCERSIKVRLRYVTAGTIFIIFVHIMFRAECLTTNGNWSNNTWNGSPPACNQNRYFRVWVKRTGSMEYYCNYCGCSWGNRAKTNNDKINIPVPPAGLRLANVIIIRECFRFRYLCHAISWMELACIYQATKSRFNHVSIPAIGDNSQHHHALLWGRSRIGSRRNDRAGRRWYSCCVFRTYIVGESAVCRGCLIFDRIRSSWSLQSSTQHLTNKSTRFFVRQGAARLNVELHSHWSEVQKIPLGNIGPPANQCRRGQTGRLRIVASWLVERIGQSSTAWEHYGFLKTDDAFLFPAIPYSKQYPHINNIVTLKLSSVFSNWRGVKKRLWRRARWYISITAP